MNMILLTGGDFLQEGNNIITLLFLGSNINSLVGMLKLAPGIKTHKLHLRVQTLGLPLYIIIIVISIVNKSSRETN